MNIQIKRISQRMVVFKHELSAPRLYRINLCDRLISKCVYFILLNCVKDFKCNLQNTGYTASNNCIDNHSKTFCDKLIMIDLN